MVAEHIDTPIEGQMGVGGSMNILFKADLSKYVAHRPSVLYWVMQPGADVGGIGMGLVRMIRPWNEWLIVWGYDINEPVPVIMLVEQIIPYQPMVMHEITVVFHWIASFVR